MCGIIFARHFRSTANGIVWKKYTEQKSRGSDGFGFVAIEPDTGISVGRARDEYSIEKKLKDEQAVEILFHHRFPTSTPNLIEATHPIYVTHKSFKYSYYIVHNGVITNDEYLKDKHEKLGFSYRTVIKEFYKTKKTTYVKDSEVFNDSEALAIDLARYIEGQSDEISSCGAIAVMALQIDKQTRKPIALYYGRNAGNPLIIKKSRKHLVISSENIGGTLLKEDILYRYDYTTKKTTEKQVEIGSYYRHSSISPYSLYNDDYEFDEDDFVANRDIPTIDGTPDLWTQYSEMLEMRSELEDELECAITLGDDYDRWSIGDDLTRLNTEIDKMESILGITTQQKLI